MNEVWSKNIWLYFCTFLLLPCDVLGCHTTLDHNCMCMYVWLFASLQNIHHYQAAEIHMCFLCSFTQNGKTCVDQRICIKVFVKLGDKIRNNWKYKKDNEAVWATKIKEWSHCLKDGWISVVNEEHSSRPSASRNPETIQKVLQRLVMEDCGTTMK